VHQRNIQAITEPGLGVGEPPTLTFSTIKLAEMAACCAAVGEVKEGVEELLVVGT